MGFCTVCMSQVGTLWFLGLGRGLLWFGGVVMMGWGLDRKKLGLGIGDLDGNGLGGPLGL